MRAGLSERQKLKPKELEMERQVVNPEERGLDGVGERGTSVLGSFSPDVRACRRCRYDARGIPGSCNRHAMTRRRRFDCEVWKAGRESWTTVCFQVCLCEWWTKSPGVWWVRKKSV